MGLFHNIKYCLASSLPLGRQEQIEYTLSKNGAMKADSIVNATHVITDSPNFPGCESVPDNIAIVSVSHFQLIVEFLLTNTRRITGWTDPLPLESPNRVFLP
jgi:hypothetical protein